MRALCTYWLCVSYERGTMRLLPTDSNLGSFSLKFRFALAYPMGFVTDDNNVVIATAQISRNRH